MIKKPEDNIPEQREGTAVNVEEKVTFQDEAAAGEFYQRVKSRLLDINHWGDISGALSADFRLTDSGGHDVSRTPQEGDYFRIDIPAPGIQTGEGYDWVRIEQIIESAEGVDECVSIRVRPTSSPLNRNNDVAHFYTDAATSNFIVKRKGTEVTAGVYGRNEKPNIEEANSLLDKARNAIVGTGGVTLFSQMQWKALVNGLISH
jgi:hypothetical protein